jgi:hypothetical protein
VSEERPDKRVDMLVDALARTRPRLDEFTRARVGAFVTSVRAPQPVPHARGLRGWGIGVACAAALALVVGVAVHGRDDAPPAVAEPSGVAAPSDRAPAPALREGEPLVAASGGSARGELAGAVVTLYGPGWATRHARRIVADADALVVDRSGDDEPVELAVRSATIRVQRATFSVDSARLVRVTVMRGSIELRCADTPGTRQVAAGESATCGAAIAGVVPSGSGASAAPAAVAPAAPPAPAPAPERVPRAAPAERAPPDQLPPVAPVDRPAAAVVAREPTPVADEPAPAGRALAPRDSMVITEGLTNSHHASAETPLAIATLTRPARRDNNVDDRALAPPPVDVAPVDPVASYAAAERLMTSNPGAARTALRELVARAPDAPEAANALLDLATLAVRSHDYGGARDALDRLGRHPGAAALAMPARYLRCYIALNTADKLACYVRFRAAFPGSPYDAEMLAGLASSYAAAGDCASAVPLLVEYGRRYPSGASAATLEAWRVQCMTGKR